MAKRAVQRRSVSKPGAPREDLAPLSLREAQALFQAAILDGDPRILARLCDSSRTTRDTLFGVYQYGYAARLVEILGNDFEVVAALCGDELFDELAHAYVVAHPSQTQNARYYSQHFPAFVAAYPALAGRPEIGEVAHLEQALGTAFDAPDADLLTLAGLAALPPEQWGRLQLAPHPSAQLLSFTTNAFEIWRRVGAEADDAAPSQAKNNTGAPSHQTPEPPFSVLVWRQGPQPMARALSAEEAMMWREAAAGRTFDALCEMLATFDDPASAAVRAAGYLQGWLSDETLASATLAAKPQKRATSAKRATR